MTSLIALQRIAGPISLSDEEVEQNQSLTERYEQGDGLEGMRGPSTANLPPEVASLSDEALGKFISQEAHDLVLYYEVSGQAGYLKKYKYPCWPGLSSGITIGIGYDVGYNSPQGFERCWKPLLPDPDFAALSRTVSCTGQNARSLVPSVKHIEIPWDSANLVYRATTVPTFARLVLATFPNAGELHPHSFGALFSLVYNRGSSLNGPKRQHMRNIYNHMRDRRFGQVPREIRNMKVLWPASMSGLHKRRDSEAMLFEQGLIEADRATYVPTTTAPGTTSGAWPQSLPQAGLPGTQSGAAPDRGSRSGALGLMESFEGDWAGQPEDLTEDMPQTRSVDPGFETLDRSPAWTAVSWVQNEDSSTEYRHITKEDRALKDCEFEFMARDMELLIRANAFEPDRTAGKIIFGLRGAMLLGGTSSPDDRQFQIERASLRLKEFRPDHHDFRCVIGVYDLTSQRLSGFIASTVAKRGVVYAYAKNGSPACNLLPCGCYVYEVGPHRGKEGCLRETEDYAVLRNRNNLAFDTSDTWDLCFPADNIHPAFADPSGSAKFSSLGCQVIQGSINKSTGEHSGVWAKFRTALGLVKPGAGDHKKRFNYILLTGLEAAIAVRLREEGKDTDATRVLSSLGRLRQGSRGDLVRRLQAGLGLQQTGILDAANKIALAKHQSGKLRWADGIHTPALDAELSLNVFGSAPPAPFVVASAGGGANGNADRGQDTLEQLYYEIGRRSSVAARGMGEESLDTEAVTRTNLSQFIGVGQRVFSRIERAAFDLICGGEAADGADRAAIQEALANAAKLGPDQVINRLTNILVASLGIGNPIAAVAAKIIVRRILEPALKDAQGAAGQALQGCCQTWAQNLNKGSSTVGPSD